MGYLVGRGKFERLPLDGENSAELGLSLVVGVVGEKGCALGLSFAGTGVNSSQRGFKPTGLVTFGPSFRAAFKSLTTSDE